MRSWRRKLPTTLLFVQQWDRRLTAIETPKLRITGLYKRNPPVKGGLPLQRASHVGRVSMSWRHPDVYQEVLTYLWAGQNVHVLIQRPNKNVRDFRCRQKCIELPNFCRPTHQIYKSLTGRLTDWPNERFIENTSAIQLRSAVHCACCTKLSWFSYQLIHTIDMS